MRPYRAILALLLAPLIVVACNEPAAPAAPITDTYFDTSLHINLAAMTKTTDGLYYVDQVVGTGIAAATGDSAYIYYSGYLSTGKKFDGTVVGAPFALNVGDGTVIVGFNEGVTGMRIGGTRTIIIPPEIGYGDTPQGSIPPNSILVFTLQLINVKRN